MIGNPLGLLALLAIPAIIGIHLFRHRFRPRRVSGLFLWRAPGQDPSSGRRLHRLERHLSLLLELAIAVLLALYLLDLRLDAEASLPHRVVVLDSSASMDAHDGDDRAAERARELIRGILRDAGAQAQVSVVATGPEPALLVGPAAPIQELDAALASWVPSARAHDLAPSLELARELAGPGVLVHVVSDRIPDLVTDPWVHWHAVGRPLANAGILAARRERGPDQDRVFLSIGCFDTAGSVTVDVAIGESFRDSRTLVFEAAGERRLALDVPADPEPVRVTLSPDALDRDDHALLLRPAARQVEYALRLPEGVLRTALTWALAAMPDVVEAEEGAAPHLVFAPTTVSATGLPETWWCRFGPPDPERTTPTKPETWAGPFLSDRGRPMLEGVSLAGVIWGGVQPGGETLEALVSVEDRVLIGADRVWGDRSLVLNIDLEQSGLQDTSDWPVLLDNLVRSRRAGLVGSDVTNLRAGDDLPVRLPPGDEVGYTLDAPDGRSRPVAASGRTVLTHLETPGIWHLRGTDGADLHAFAVNFQDAAESDLRDAATGDRPPVSAAREDEREGESVVDPKLHFPLLLAGLAAFLANVFWLRRTGTARRADA